MVIQDIVNYLKEGMSRGFSIQLLKKKLLEGGFKEKDIDDAVGFVRQNMKPKMSEKSKPVLTKKNVKPLQNFNSISKPNMKNADYGKMAREKIGLFRKIGMSLAHPKLLFEKTKSESVWSALGFFYFISLVPFILGSAALFFLISVITAYLDSIPFLPVASIVSPSFLILVFSVGLWIFVVSPIMLFISAGILHLFVKLYKGIGIYADTFRAIVYSFTPSMLFFFIPFIGIWTFVLSLFGLSANHQISKGRAFLVYLTFFVLITIISLVVFLLVGFN